MRKLVIATIALVTLMGAACTGGGGGSSSSVSTGTSSSIGSPACPPQDRIGVPPLIDFTSDASFTIAIKDGAFHPICLIAKNGSTITVTNKDTYTHNFSIIGIGVDVTIPGSHTRSTAIPSLAPATYYFYCPLYPRMMIGTMIVVP